MFFDATATHVTGHRGFLLVLLQLWWSFLILCVLMIAGLSSHLDIAGYTRIPPPSSGADSIWHGGHVLPTFKNGWARGAP